MYIILPFCDVGDVGKEILHKQKIPENEAVEILKQILAGLN